MAHRLPGSVIVVGVMNFVLGAGCAVGIMRLVTSASLPLSASLVETPRDAGAGKAIAAVPIKDELAWLVYVPVGMLTAIGAVFVFAGLLLRRGERAGRTMTRGLSLLFLALAIAGTVASTVLSKDSVAAAVESLSWLAYWSLVLALCRSGEWAQVFAAQEPAAQ